MNLPPGTLHHETCAKREKRGWPESAAMGLTCVGWFFWNEDRSYAHGPYHTVVDAESDALAYYRSVVPENKGPMGLGR